MEDKYFEVDLERSRIYWDYYKSLFLVLSHSLIAGMICAAIIYSAGGLDLTYTAGIIGLMFLCVILLCALMSLTIWRHENKHLDELIRIEEEAIQQRPGNPIV